MLRFFLIGSLGIALLLVTTAAAIGGWGWWALVVLLAFLLGVGIHDLVQKRHSVLRNYPVIGHMRYLLESIRPEIQQYFIERNVDGRPFSREVRTVIYERAKGIHGEQSFGTERDIERVGYEYLVHSTAPVSRPDHPPRVLIGGPDCTAKYSMSLLNVSAMSFGALSANALRALDTGAALGGFAHDTGEGGLTPYHLDGGADLVWEIGSGYFGARTDLGDFAPDEFADKAAYDQIKMVALKLSQGAKPGIGGVLPAAKVSAEIAIYRGVPAHEKCVSPAAHSAFGTPRELIQFIARMRELSGGKPTGFKLCVGSRMEFLAICKAMLSEGTAPDFIIVDGAEGGTAAAPLEYEDNVGLPLTSGLMTVHNALVATGLRDRIRIGASGKIATGHDIVKRLIQGADYTNAARAMMMAIGCIQAQKCHTNTCPVGVATQDPKRAHALNVGDKSLRVRRYHEATVDQAVQIMSSLGARDPADLSTDMLRKKISPTVIRSYTELYEWLEPGELLADPPESWAADWAAATPDSFRSQYTSRT